MKVRTKKVILFALWLVIAFPVFGMLLSGLSAPSTITNLVSVLESYNRQKSSGETAVTEHNEHLL